MKKETAELSRMNKCLRRVFKLLNKETSTRKRLKLFHKTIIESEEFDIVIYCMKSVGISAADESDCGKFLDEEYGIRSEWDRSKLSDEGRGK